MSTIDFIERATAGLSDGTLAQQPRDHAEQDREARAEQEHHGEGHVDGEAVAAECEIAGESAEGLGVHELRKLWRCRRRSPTQT